MPVLFYVVYPCMLLSVWYETMTGQKLAVPTSVSESAVQDT
jgi:hypothetical protein